MRRLLGADLVFEGGGALGAAYPGAISALEEHKIFPYRVAGTSAGSMIAAMVAAGFKANEIKWLVSDFPNAGPAPISLRSIGLNEPLSFRKFMDLEGIENLSDEEREGVLLWKFLYEAVDIFISRISTVDVPTPQEMSVDIATAITDSTILGLASELVGKRDELQAVIEGAISVFIPAGHGPIGSIITALQGQTENITQAIWDYLEEFHPPLIFFSMLVHRGFMFKGDYALKAFERILSLKIHNDENTPVYFKDLKYPLAVTALNIRDNILEIYSETSDDIYEDSGNGTDNREITVAEAVRRSISVPVVFQARGNQNHIVDGGLASNFPTWLFTESARNYWPDTHQQKTKVIGFTLNEQLRPPRGNYNAPRFSDAEATDVNVISLSLKTAVEDAYRTSAANTSVRRAALRAIEEFFESDNPGKLFEMIGMLSRADKENTLKPKINAALMNGFDFKEVEIPLAGYHWMDFNINSDQDALIGMWQRAERVTNDALDTTG
ncbi:hypothetical protein MED297_13927 [Reinekea sp. MED297]|uniref:PNPLA domain-containing protein n=2 Tax=Reinekea TaxID=230494 RepID=A4BHY2_9GAMM|nr:hypothetical protein MED297_13927 [Reinekea sp. MED297] [Reinekea blandensis MED297]